MTRTRYEPYPRSCDSIQLIPRPPNTDHQSVTHSPSSSPLPPVRRVLGLAPAVLLLHGGLLGPPQLLHDLVLEVLLVLQDVALPLGHRLLLADPDLVRHLESEGFVKLSFDIPQIDMRTIANMNDRLIVLLRAWGPFAANHLTS